MAEDQTSTTQKPKLESDRLDPWVEDGNIVLAVQGKHFRVHRSTLISYSEVFKDMFDCNEPQDGASEGKERIEECPVVQLHDAVADVQVVLKAMYDRSYPAPYYKTVPISIVAAFLRLGEKYAIRRLFDEAKARLCCPYEPTLGMASRISPHSGALTLFPGIAQSDPHNFQVMNLLQEMDLQAPLPLAMFQCVTSCPIAAVVDGYKFNVSMCTLSHANLRSYILLKNILENFRVRFAQSLRVSTSCIVQSSCACNVHRVWSDAESVAQPFGPWRREWDKLFCDACRKDVGMCRNAAMQKAWGQVPTAFGFESWAEVAKSGDFPSLTYQ